MIWGYPYFWKHPYNDLDDHTIYVTFRCPQFFSLVQASQILLPYINHVFNVPSIYFHMFIPGLKFSQGSSDCSGVLVAILGDRKMP